MMPLVLSWLASRIPLKFSKSKNDTWPAGLVIHLNLHPIVDDDLISILGQKRFQMRAREP